MFHCKLAHPCAPPVPPSPGLLFFRHGRNTTLFIDAWQKQLDSDESVSAEPWGRWHQAGYWQQAGGPAIL